MITESQSVNQKPTTGEMLGHIFVGPNGEHLVFTLFTVGVAAVWGLSAARISVGEFFAGHLGDGLNYVATGILGLIPMGVQAWFLGTEGWTPGFEAAQNKLDAVADNFSIPPQL